VPSEASRTCCCLPRPVNMLPSTGPTHGSRTYSIVLVVPKLKSSSHMHIYLCVTYCVVGCGVVQLCSPFLLRKQLALRRPERDAPLPVFLLSRSPLLTQTRGQGIRSACRKGRSRSGWANEETGGAALAVSAKRLAVHHERHSAVH
jgi:hypothetical protein